SLFWMANLLSARLAVSWQKSYQSAEIGPEKHHRFIAVFPLTSPPIKDHRHAHSVYSLLLDSLVRYLTLSSVARRVPV
ncbi:hypothetical protein BKA83DRAFT_4332953, partial [Pisolithus microcarpus]